MTKYKVNSILENISNSFKEGVIIQNHRVKNIVSIMLLRLFSLCPDACVLGYLFWLSTLCPCVPGFS